MFHAAIACDRCGRKQQFNNSRNSGSLPGVRTHGVACRQHQKARPGMKSGILALSAVACAVWLTMATEPITIVAGHSDLKPISTKAEIATATKGTQTHGEAPQAILGDYLDYLTTTMQTWAEEAINGRRSNADQGTGTDDTGADDAGQSDILPESDCESSQETERNSGTDYQSTLTFLGDFVVTFYDLCPECTGPWYGMNTTASGRDPAPWYTVAAGPSLPFGTVIYIEGFGTFEVMDRGVADGCIDILVNNHSEIPSYGMAVANTYLINE